MTGFLGRRLSAERARTPLWLWPAVASTAALAAALLLGRIRPQQGSLLSWLWRGGATSAASVLQGVATSVMTATALTFRSDRPGSGFPLLPRSRLRPAAPFRQGGTIGARGAAPHAARRAVACRDDDHRSEVRRAADLVVEQMDENVLKDDADAVRDLYRRVDLALSGHVRAAYADRVGETRSI